MTDGDTLRALCPRIGLASIRLLGFDAPELSEPRCGTERWRALQATAALWWHLFRAERIELLPGRRDRYGRSLSRLVLDGRNLAHMMITSGHARAYAGGRRAGWCGPGAA